MYQLTWKNKKAYESQKPFNLKASVVTREIEKALPINWEEHCVECAVPDCYKSCSLYKPRADLKCARFTYGIYPNPSTSGLFNYGADISFERWAKLESFWPRSPKMVKLSHLRLEEAVISTIQNIIFKISTAINFIDPKKTLSRLVNRFTEHWVRIRFTSKNNKIPPDAFYMQFYYPGTESRNLQLEISGDQPFFRCSVEVLPGWNEKIIDYSELNKDFTGHGRISLWPEDDKPIRLIFNWLDLVVFKKAPEVKQSIKPAEKVKCVCWDLDNTLWDGVIGDEGLEGVNVNQTMVNLIKDLDKKGILQSVVSKNEYELAWSKIQKEGLEEYFLYPAIHWGPKSESISNIASKLNINIDTFAVIDDSEWERNEISSRFPQVRTYDPENIDDLINYNEFKVAITSETRKRRQMYSIEAGRKTISEDWGDNFYGFLQSCNMVMRIEVPNNNQLDRCLELLQRTNQFNLSGKVFSKDVLSNLISKPEIIHFCVSLKDRFGDYGIVMFVIIENKDEVSTITDFVMSCRVAQKMADLTFLQWCLDNAQQLGNKALNIKLRKTNKNKPLRDLLDSLPANDISTSNDYKLLKISTEEDILDSKVIEILTS
jgi:FkbH-like protein